MCYRRTSIVTERIGRDRQGRFKINRKRTKNGIKYIFLFTAVLVCLRARKYGVIIRTAATILFLYVIGVRLAHMVRRMKIINVFNATSRTRQLLARVQQVVDGGGFGDAVSPYATHARVR